ncbi:hypothetical protein [Desulfocurvus sp. DL9XJH121]
MNKRRITILVLALALLGLAGVAQAQDAAPGEGAETYVQQADDGQVDWGSGMITAKGVFIPPQGMTRGMAERAATVIARRNLLEILKGVQIDSTTTVQNTMVNDVVVSQVRGFLQNTMQLNTAYMSDGAVEITVGMKLHGAFSDVVMPDSAKFKAKSLGAAPAAQAPAAAWTGLVVDARGLGVRPAMSPRIVDEAGAEIYGTAVVDREYAIRQGMAGYAKDPQAAAANPRVAGNPLTVAAVGVTGRAATDLVIPTAKADEIRAREESSRILSQARVMILLD